MKKNNNNNDAHFLFIPENNFPVNRWIICRTGSGNSLGLVTGSMKFDGTKPYRPSKFLPS